jgi:hypothetical protein
MASSEFDPDWEPEAEATRRMAAGILAGLPLGRTRPPRHVEPDHDRRDASVTRCTCGSWRMRGRACDTCGATP